MHIISKASNPIQQVAMNTPTLVWNHFQEILTEKIGELNITQSEKNSFRQTIVRHANGERGAGALRTMNIFLRRVIEDTWPVTTDFFEGNADEMSAAAEETAAQMIAEFEALLENQKAALPL